MKKLIRPLGALLLGAFLLVGPSSFAQATTGDKPFVAATYPSANPLKLWVTIQKNDPKSKIIVRLRDQNNRVLFAQTMPRNLDKYRQRFDMSEMADGAYTFQITNGDETIEKAFQLKSSGIQQRSTQRLLTVVPVVEPQTGM
ncbi:hypothetical protein [Larkinella humicola]|uniref:Secreted protein (Por secretion system target) n=1 Tax=Larkinella humicola TaxID=2607654 RepID=A0A5N1JGU5_9BACT|nr:hypothetical protein [Larkinella humicola]KAA9353717.1 hypothetical protein F0P93_13885 [Larkinella humicola]